MKSSLIMALVTVLLVAGCARSEARLQVAGTDITALAKSSDVIVIGTVLGEGPVVNIARDPNDLSREHPTLKVLAQEYRVAVGSSLKGVVTGTIAVTVARWDQHAGLEPVAVEAFVPLDTSARYLLFLRRHPHDPTLFAIAFEPSRFKLGAQAVVQSPWAPATTAFPPRDAAAFIADVTRVIATQAAGSK